MATIFMTMTTTGVIQGTSPDLVQAQKLMLLALQGYKADLSLNTEDVEASFVAIKAMEGGQFEVAENKRSITHKVNGEELFGVQIVDVPFYPGTPIVQQAEITQLGTYRIKVEDNQIMMDLIAPAPVAQPAPAAARSPATTPMPQGKEGKEGKVFNPKTKRWVAIGGKAYNDLVKEGLVQAVAAPAAQPAPATAPEGGFAPGTKVRNPKTGRAIEVGTTTYNKLVDSGEYKPSDFQLYTGKDGKKSEKKKAASTGAPVAPLLPVPTIFQQMSIPQINDPLVPTVPAPVNPVVALPTVPLPETTV